MRDKKTIGHFLFKNSMVIIVLTVMIYVLSVLIGKRFFDNLLVVNLNWKGIEASETYTYPFENINSESIEALGGWIEILDENMKVIYVKGEKQDDLLEYDEYQLLNYSAAIHKDTQKYPFIYNIYPVENLDGRQYLYIVKFPKTLYHVSVISNLTALIKHPNAIHIIIVSVVISLFLLIFLTVMHFYNKFTSKHINIPLKYLMCGINEMELQNYKYRMDFHAEKEFACIRDCFNKMAERLEYIEAEKILIEKSRQRLLTDISHDLKTPITSILGFSKLLNEGEEFSSEERNRYIGYIYKKSNYIAALIDELFEIAKLEDEGFEFTYHRTDVTEWLRQAVSEIYPEFENKNITLDINICETPIILNFDAKQMKRAVFNLLYNALKYNPSETIVHIYFHKEVDKIILRIEDNGIGIPEEIRSRIFDPFVRKEEVGATDRGSGLGLAITKKIIERHNGRISLTSNSEDITIFTIEFPCLEIP